MKSCLSYKGYFHILAFICHARVFWEEYHWRLGGNENGNGRFWGKQSSTFGATSPDEVTGSLSHRRGLLPSKREGMSTSSDKGGLGEFVSLILLALPMSA